jgi:branched-chain amino acid transport system ATP-binding protein
MRRAGMLEVRGLATSYGNIMALKGIDLSVAEGRTVCILGANGAGKTTLMKTVSGLLAPSGGRIAFRGEDIARLSPSAIVRKGIALVPEGRAILSRMTVLENLEMGAYHRRDVGVRKDLEAVLARFPILGERKGQRGGSLSGGEQQMLAIARALLARPRLLLLDEPSLGLAPLVVADIFRIIREINAEGTTVLLVEQNVRQALKVSDYAYVLETGRIVHEAPSRELRNDPKIMESYLGGGQR